LSDFFTGWFSSEFLEKELVGFVVRVYFIDQVDRNSYMFAHICDGFGNGLFDPSGCIGRKFELFVGIKFFNSFDKSDIPFLDKIRK
jgi:hypothetical protein